MKEPNSVRNHIPLLALPVHRNRLPRMSKLAKKITHSRRSPQESPTSCVTILDFPAMTPSLRNYGIERFISILAS